MQRREKLRTTATTATTTTEYVVELSIRKTNPTSDCGVPGLVEVWWRRHLQQYGGDSTSHKDYNSDNRKEREGRRVTLS